MRRADEVSANLGKIRKRIDQDTKEEEDEDYGEMEGHHAMAYQDHVDVSEVVGDGLRAGWRVGER